MRLWLYLTLVVNSIILLAFIGYGGYTASEQTAWLTKNLENDTRNMARNISAGSADDLLLTHFDKIENSLLRQVMLGSVRELVVADNNARILMQVERGSNGQARSVYEHVSQPLDLSQSEVRTLATYTLLLPIERGERLGWVRVTTSLSALESLRRQIWANTLLASLLTIVLTGALLAFFLRKATAALGDATEFAGDLIRQRGVSMPTISRIVEIQQLTRALNSAAQALATQFLALQDSQEKQQSIAAMLRQSAKEMQSQQEELRQNNEELEEKNKLLEDHKVEVEQKNREIEAARLTLEEKAEQLALTSQYKSEFLSNMSHELRTPLNSVLILAQLLAENAEHNLSEKQIEYAKTIQGAGKDLLALINEILDLAKIESGTVMPDLDDVSLANVGEQLERAFRHVAEKHGLGFSVELAPGLPPSIYTDSQRLQQVMKNLLSNAFKFTNKGQVSVRIAAVESGWSVKHDGLNRAEAVIGFFVTDSGIGLAADKQKIIFEAFQQASTGTTRQYGGTGLGLSISREIAWLLGGELHLVESAPGQGSTFALYLPLRAPEFGQGRTS